jgi:hypothetical protein
MEKVLQLKAEAISFVTGLKKPAAAVAAKGIGAEESINRVAEKNRRHNYENRNFQHGADNFKPC